MPIAALRRAAAIAVLILAGGCMGRAQEPVNVGFGANPQLPEPSSTLIPVINIAEAGAWSEGEAPTAAPGLEAAAFARGLQHPRWIHVLSNGDVLVAESNAPERPDHGNGIRGFFEGLVMKNAGAGTPSANRITLLRDADGDGEAEMRTTFISGLKSPFGITDVGGSIYVANTDGIVRFPYSPGLTDIKAAGVYLTALPAGDYNHHWTKNVVASPDGTKLYATVGSNSNIAEKGMAMEEGRAAIWEIDTGTGDKRLFATGLRNPNGMDFEPETGVLWTAVNERDEIGHNLVPDYITSVKDGAFYGWPWSYFGPNADTRVKPARPDMVAKAIAPDYAVGAHTASLGLTFADGAALGGEFSSGAFIGQHGSWNRRPHSGYKVIFVPFRDGRPAGEAVDVLTGFLDDAGKVARGRPVGVAIARDGSLLVADDVGNTIWRVSAPGVANVQSASVSDGGPAPSP